MLCHGNPWTLSTDLHPFFWQDLSRLEMGALKLGNEPFSPYEIALQAVKMSRAQGEGKNVKIELEADEETKRMVVKGDRESAALSWSF